MSDERFHSSVWTIANVTGEVLLKVTFVLSLLLFMSDESRSIALITSPFILPASEAPEEFEGNELSRIFAVNFLRHKFMPLYISSTK